MLTLYKKTGTNTNNIQHDYVSSTHNNKTAIKNHSKTNNNNTTKQNSNNTFNNCSNITYINCSDHNNQQHMNLNPKHSINKENLVNENKQKIDKAKEVCHKCQTEVNSLLYLSCLHLYCLPCLKTITTIENYLVCVKCGWKESLSQNGGEDLHKDAVNVNLEILQQETHPPQNVFCTLCRPQNVRGKAVAFCWECPMQNAFLCEECKDAHTQMNRFKTHQIEPLSMYMLKNDFKTCHRHPLEKVCVFCKWCKKKGCKVCCQDCMYSHGVVDFMAKGEEIEDEVRSLQIEQDEVKSEAVNLFPQVLKKKEEMERVLNEIKIKEDKMKDDIEKDFVMMCQLMDIRKTILQKEVTCYYGKKKVYLEQKSQQLDRISLEVTEVLKHANRHREFCSQLDASFFEYVFEDKLKFKDNLLTDFKPEVLKLQYRRKVNDEMKSAIANVMGSFVDENNMAIDLSLKNGKETNCENKFPKKNDVNKERKRFSADSPSSSSSNKTSSDKQKNNKNHKKHINNLPNSIYNLEKASKKKFGKESNDLKVGQVRDRKSESNHSQDDIFSKADMFQIEDSCVKSVPCVNNKGAIIRKKIYCKFSFGEEGDAEYQFLEPGGVCSNSNNEIIIADANNHQIKIFDNEGNFLKNIGGFIKKREVEKKQWLMKNEGTDADEVEKILAECRDPEDTPLVYPNRVFVCPLTGNIVVTERTPTNRVQVISREGLFLYEFGQTLISHPRGVTVDSCGNILVLESKVNRIWIFTESGKMKKKFYLSQADFPNSIAVNTFKEIFVADNKRHCVHVYTYKGDYVREIGGQGSTNYPISVSIGPQNEVLVMDNHANFNVTMFSREGILMAAVQSDFKHNQCYNSCLMPNGCVLVSTRDHKIYVYSLPHYFFKSAIPASAQISDSPALEQKNSNVNTGYPVSSETINQIESQVNSQANIQANSQANSQVNSNSNFMNIPSSLLDQLSLGTEQQLVNSFEINPQLSNSLANNHLSNFNSPRSINIPHIWSNESSNSYNNAQSFDLNSMFRNTNNNYASNNNFNPNNHQTNQISDHTNDLFLALLNKKLHESSETTQQSSRNLMSPVQSARLLQPTQPPTIKLTNNCFNNQNSWYQSSYQQSSQIGFSNGNNSIEPNLFYLQPFLQQHTPIPQQHDIINHHQQQDNPHNLIWQNL